MTARLNPWTASPATMKALLDFSTALQPHLLEPTLMELVKIRASQLNGCAYCLHMHSTEARAAGESEDRIVMLAAWEESPLYTDRERAALGWTDAMTRLSSGPAPDEVYAAVKWHFNEEEQVKLTMMIAIINAWNRFGAGFRTVHPVEKQKAA